MFSSYNKVYKNWRARKEQLLYKPTEAQAPACMTGYDAVEIRVTLTPLVDGNPVHQVGAIHWVSMLDAKDQRAIAYVTRNLLDQLMAAWNFGDEEQNT